MFGDTGHPKLVGAITAEAAVDEVFAGVAVGIGAFVAPARGQPSNPQIAHDRPDQLEVHDLTISIAKVRPNLSSPVGLAGLRPDLGDQVSEPCPANEALTERC